MGAINVHRVVQSFVSNMEVGVDVLSWDVTKVQETKTFVPAMVEGKDVPSIRAINLQWEDQVIAVYTVVESKYGSVPQLYVLIMSFDFSID